MPKLLGEGEKFLSGFGKKDEEKEVEEEPKESNKLYIVASWLTKEGILSGSTSTLEFTKDGSAVEN